MIEHLIKAATCRVTCGTESGTGWLIGRDRVLTARHCVLQCIDEGNPIELHFPNSEDAAMTGVIVAHSEDWDVCLVSLDPISAAEPLAVGSELPREGETWQTFGYPQAKASVGHRLTGTVAQVLETPALKIDLDLLIDTDVTLQDYRGMSGGSIVCEGIVVGIIRLKIDGTVAAVSLNRLEDFLTENGVNLASGSTPPSAPLLADRGEEFSESFAEGVLAGAGSYLFLEGAHGIGKSTFCRYYQVDDDKVINMGAYCLSDPDSALGASYRAQPSVFLDWLTTTIAGHVTGKAPRKEEKNSADHIRVTSEYLNAFSKHCQERGRQGMFFVDGLNEISGASMLDALLGMLPEKLPSNITVVLTSPNFSNIAPHLAGKVKTNDVFGLPRLPDSACYAFCQQTIDPERGSPALLDRICERAKGHPLYLRYLIEYVNSQDEDNELDDFPVLTGSIEDYYQRIWARLLLDSHAVNLLALMARMRWGVSLADFAKALNPAEQTHFVSVVSRIRHLLAHRDSTAIYHSSFEAFVVEQTAEIEQSIYRRLAKFCVEEPTLRYCALNLVYHLTRADDATVFSQCSQDWFDTAVTLGGEPDALIEDVDAVVRRAAMEAPAEEFFRLSLLAQRISFRYNTLFAQSARLIAEALIVTGRSEEALQHVMRLKTLIVGPSEALEIAFLLYRHGHDNEALTLLGFVERRIIESYHPPIELHQLLDCCCFHLKTDLRIGLVTDRSRMEQFQRIIDLARNACAEAFEDDSEKVVHCMQPVISVPTAHFLAFRDKYTGLSNLKEEVGKEADLSGMLPSLCLALLNFEDAVEDHHLPKHRNSLGRLFADLAELISTAEIDSHVADAVANTLIRFGAPSNVVELFAANGGTEAPGAIHIRAKNGVDVNYDELQQRLCDWRIAAFLDSAFRGPSSGIVAGISWVETIEHLVGALFCCDGRARRAVADSDEAALSACRDQLKAQVIDPLCFSLEERADWTDSYAIPENLLPWVFSQLTELLNDCFPEALPEWLDSLVSKADGQWGMYSEGFRDSAYQVLMQLTRDEPSDALTSRLISLLNAWRDHVLRGVENRHELVPEILRMIPIFAHLGADEEAERLYQRLLSVSMGPTWYKEDQLGIMTEVLGSIAVSTNVEQRLPEIAGYLERASGEMTFQRYVRAEKSSLLGEIARRGKYRAALRYFRRQCCGSLDELWAEAAQGPIDKVGPLKGNRFPGGALDDQAAILALVRSSGTVSWALRWALLEIFYCGDSRHLTDYAKAFANLANEAGASPELIRRAEIVANAETQSDDQSSFASAFRSGLKHDLHATFAAMLDGLPPAESPKPHTPRIEREADDDDEDSGFFKPGVFGRQKDLRQADKILEVAEKQLSLGNRSTAKIKAVEVLATAQDGGWCIWGNLSDSAARAEEILVNDEVNAANVVRYYAPLIEAEQYVPQWIPAQHLIAKVGSLLDEPEGQYLLDSVIDHVRLVVGDASVDIETFAFLADGAPEIDPDVEFFQFIVWLCNHPQWLRRDRAAAMLLWLVEQVPELFFEAVNTAFSMEDGYGPDVLCGVLDGLSAREPEVVWDKVAEVFDLTKGTKELRHVSRMVVLERLAARGDKAASPSAKGALEMIRSKFTAQCASDDSRDLPAWAAVLAPEWKELSSLVGADAVKAWESKLEQCFSSLTIADAHELETAVLKSFRENHRPLDRWESRLRYSLNVALWSFVSRAEAKMVEAALRIYNPSHPERSVLGMNNAFTDELMVAIESGNYSAAFGSSANVMLNYHDMAVKPEGDGLMGFEVLCVLQPASIQSGAFGPPLDQSFRSSELPHFSSVRTPFETCCRLKPEVLFFGSFTPAIPLPFFQNLVGARDEDFIRENWRYSRRNEIRGLGQPERCGCSLSIPRNTLKVPAGFRLAWIVLIDGEVVAVVDERNN